MAIYNFSSTTSVTTFNPASDTLNFDSASIDAALVTIAPSGTGLSVTAVGKTLILPNMSLTQISATNLTFASGSKYLVGDNQAGIVNDDNANTLTGGTGRDVLIGLGGNDKLDGGAGADILKGGLGDDTYVVDNTGDTVTENSNEGTDTVQSSVTFTLPNNVENLTLTGTAAINGIGNALNNTIIGNAGNNSLDGGAGNDSLVGGDGNNTLSGGSGNDTLIGGKGNDTYIVDSSLDVLYEGTEGGGTDTVQSSISWTLDGFFENLTLIGTSAINGTGNDDNNVITGNSASNVLDGGIGADTLIGGDGNDIYYVNSTDDVIQETSTPPTSTVPQIDLIKTSSSYTLPVNVENIQLMGAGNLSATGNAGNNVFYPNVGNNTIVGGGGNDTVSYESLSDSTSALMGVNVSLAISGAQNTFGSGSDTLTGIQNLTGSRYNDTLTGNGNANILNGSLGADSMVGGDGNDTYIVDNGSDTVVETNANPSQSDTVMSSVDYRLPDNVENLTLTGTTALNATGNSLANIITGNDSANVLDGAGGFDSLVGGKGNDSYIIHGNETIVENPGEGTDAVYVSGINYSLANAQNVENLYLLGSDNINGTGNSVANTIYANTGNNVLDGGVNSSPTTMSDTVSYEIGATAGVKINLNLTTPQITGGSGTDTLIGFDNVIGSSFNDTFTPSPRGNLINGGAGIDTVDYSGATGGIKAVLSPTTTATDTGTVSGKDLLLNIENLTGSAFDDTIVMSAASNLVNGGAGNDTVSYETNTRGVTVNLGVTTKQAVGGSGYDRFVSIESVTGSGFNDKLVGSTGNNVLTGGVGADTLTGAAGADTFKYLAVADSTDVGTSAKGVDVITDFTQGQDKIDIKALLAHTAAVPNPFNFIGTAPLDGGTKGVGEIHYETDNVTGNTIVIVDTSSSTGAVLPPVPPSITPTPLYYDFKIILQGTIALTPDDFILF